MPVFSENTSAESPQSVLYLFSSLIQFSQADIHNLKQKTLGAGGGGNSSVGDRVPSSVGLVRKNEGKGEGMEG